MDHTSAVRALASILGWFALVALIAVGLETIVGLVKPPDLLKHCGAVIGVSIALLLLVSALVSLWLTMSPWSRIGLATVGLFIWQIRRAQRPPRRSKAKE